MTNEAGISINGDDYAGYHDFNADGSRVVYGDMTDLIHVTTMLRSRDTTTGELLWSTELDRPVGPTHWYGDRIVALAPADGVPGGDHEAVIVLDAAHRRSHQDRAHHPRPRLRRLSGTVPAMSETTPLSVFEPAGEAKGGLVVIQEIFGVNDHIEDVCRRLADEGWLAVAPHLFHRSGDPKLGYDAMEDARSHAQELTADGVMEDVDAAVARIAEAGIPPVTHRHRRVLHGRQRRPGHRGASGPRRGGDVLRRRRH